MKPKLFLAPGACSLAPHICLIEAGADFDCVQVNLREGDQRKPEYLAINPQGRVPAIVTQQGVLTENPAVLEWIARSWPAARLAPLEDSWGLAQVNSFNAFIASSVHAAFAHIFRPERYAEGEAAAAGIKAKAIGMLEGYFALIDARLDLGPWIHGAAFTSSDPYVYVMSRWLTRPGMGALEPYRNLRSHIHRMQARDSVQKALADEGLDPV